MKESFIYLIAAVAAVSISAFCSYDEQRLASSRFVLGVILLSAVVGLIFNTISGITLEFADFPEIPEHESQLTEQTAKLAFEEGIQRAICDRFSLSEEEVTVEASGFDFINMRADFVAVKLGGDAALSDIRSVRSYVEKCGFGECEVECYFG